MKRGIGFLLVGGLALGCGAPAADEARVFFRFWETEPLQRSWLVVTLDDGRQRRDVSGSDLHADPNANNVWQSPDFLTVTQGTLRVDLRIADERDSVAVQGTLQLVLRPDWRWSVEIIASTRDPAEGCLGCSGSQAFALDPAFRAQGRDSLWLVWGGNFISNPVVY